MHIENNEFVLTRADARALLAFASADDTREYICGVWFDPARSRAFSTDGAAAVVAQCSGDVVSHEPPRLVPYADFESATKALGRSDVLRVSVGAPPGTGASLGTGDATVILTVDGSLRRTPRAPYSLPLVRCPDERPPPVDQVLPRLDAATRPRPAWGTFDPQLLARATLIGEAATGERDGAVEFWPAEETLMASLLVAYGDGVEWTAAIMPRRSERTTPRCSADEAITWACRVAAEETGRDETELRAAVQGVMRGNARLTEATATDAAARARAPLDSKPEKKRRSRKKPALHVVASK